MKTMFRVLTIGAALTCADTMKTLAQDEAPEPPTPPPAPVAIVHDVQTVAEDAVHKAQKDIEKPMVLVQTQLKKLRENVFRKTDRSLVVRSSAMEPRAQGDLEEDMTIMTHILDKAVSERTSDDAAPIAMGINVSFVPGEGPTRSIYVDGYGALFFLKVKYPLLPPPVEKNVEKEKTPKDSSWEEAKEEVYGQPGAKTLISRPAVEYDAARVTALKGALLDALKNASNIRSVKSDESITVCVIGAPLSTVVTTYGGGARTFRNGGGGGGGGFGGGGFGGSGGGQNGGGGGGFGAMGASGDSDKFVWVSNDDAGNKTTLTIRVKKADCEAFAHGNLTMEEFRKRAVITIYGEPTDKP
jgi:uncharacterized membrane protein YgcG